MTNFEFTSPTQEELNQFWSNVVAPRQSKIELNFKEKAITLGLINDGGKTIFIEDNAWVEKIMPIFDSQWHIEGKDELEYLILYTDDTFFCQRRKIKYDFSSKSSYWITYEFKEVDVQSVKEICEVLETVAIIQKESEINQTLEKVRELNSVDYFYDMKWYKKQDEINKMLLYSDWRLLPDAPQKFDGERDLWIVWRNELRNLLPSNPREVFETNFDMFKFVTTLKYPVDPRVYIDKYPNREVEYLSTDDQYLKYDFEASKDFVSKTMLNLVTYMETYDENVRPINAKILELAKQLKLEEVYDINYDKLTPV